MPYWSIYCLYCNGYIADALLECIPAARRAEPTFKRLFNAESGAALACANCNGLIGFEDGRPIAPAPGWPVYRYGWAELEIKKRADGEPVTTSLADWALRYRFTQPGNHSPLTDYTYAEQAPSNELVP